MSIASTAKTLSANRVFSMLNGQMHSKFVYSSNCNAQSALLIRHYQFNPVDTLEHPASAIYESCQAVALLFPNLHPTLLV